MQLICIPVTQHLIKIRITTECINRKYSLCGCCKITKLSEAQYKEKLSTLTFTKQGCLIAFVPHVML